MFAPIKKVIQKVAQYTEKKRDEKEQNDMLQKWKKKLEASKSAYDITLMDKREYLFLGDRTVEKNINSTKVPTKRANNIFNIIYELIESQVNTQIPQPTVKSKRPEFVEHAKMIEESITNDLKEIGVEAINDLNERITPVQGFSIVEVSWNPDFKNHLYRGEIELITRHPKQLIPQPKVYDLQKMDYFFILSSVTKEYVKRRYDVDMEGEYEEYPEHTSLSAIQSQLTGGVGLGMPEDEPLTEIVCWYKDEDGDICKFVWCNDTPLEHLPKFFYRRVDGEIQEKEVLDRDIMLTDGEIAFAGEEVPYFTPTRYPVSVRINVPRNFAFGGQSDVDVIRDQQDSIKRVATKTEEKMVKGGSIVKMPEDLPINITDETYQIIRGNPQQLALIGVEDMTTDISKDMNYLQYQYEVAKSMLGITDSWQGKEDTSAKSGVAKQIQVQQSGGRMQSKLFNKHAHFKEIFEIMFEFKLAYYDELRPYLAKDDLGNDKYGDFDKYKFLCRDASGELYYHTDFLFSADAGAGLPKDPMFLFQQAQEMFRSQAINQLQYFSILESLNFPHASQLKKQAEQQMNQEQMIQQLMQQNEQLMGMLNEAQQRDMSAQVEAQRMMQEQDDKLFDRAMQERKLSIDELNAVSKANFSGVR